MMVIWDSQYVLKGITEWSVKWHRHGWRVKLAQYLSPCLLVGLRCNAARADYIPHTYIPPLREAPGIFFTACDF